MNTMQAVYASLLVVVMLVCFWIFRPHLYLWRAKRVKQKLLRMSTELQRIESDIKLGNLGQKRVHLKNLVAQHEALKSGISILRYQYQNLMDIAVPRYCFYKDMLCTLAVRCKHVWLAEIIAKLSTRAERSLRSVID